MNVKKGWHLIKIPAYDIENIPKECLKMAVREQIVPTDTVYSSVLLQDILNQLQKRYPWMELMPIGNSVMGSPIWALSIGEGSVEVFYNASFHANEWITTPVLLRFAEEFLEAADQGKRIYGVDADWLYRTFRLYLVPMVNPDGVDLVNEKIDHTKLNPDGIPYYDQAQAIAAGYPRIPFPSGWKANINGVDLNLQFPAGWEEAKKIKSELGFTSFAPRDFPGDGPLTEPESLAVYRFTRQHDFHLILAYHTQGEVIYWRYLDYEPPGSRRIARYFSEVSGYEVAETPRESGYAGYKDWFIQDYNRPGYTIEAGRGENPLPVTQFEEIYDANIGILIGGMVQLLV